MKIRHILQGDRPYYRKLAKLALPIAFQNLMLACVAAADAFMLGSIEQNAMSAVSLASQIQFVQNMILMAAVSATSVLGAQYWGKKDRKAIDDIFCQGMRLCALTSTVFFVGCVFFPRYLMLLFTNEEVLISIGVQYLRIAGWSYLFTGFSQCYLAMMKVSEHAAVTAKLSFATVMLNIILNAVLIYGLGGIAPLGARGAALATLIARIAELTACIAISFRKGFLHPSLRGLFRHNALLSRDFYRCMLPLLGSSLLWGIGFTSYTAFMGHMGTEAAAASSVATVIRDLICCMCNGLANGGGILVGSALGSGDLAKGKLYGQRLAILAFVCGFASCLVMFILTPAVVHFVKLTPEAHRYLLQMMIIMSVYMIGRAVNTIVINGIFAAGGDTIFDLYSLVITMWMIAIPLAAIGTFWRHWPVYIVYACTCLDEVGKIPWVMAHYKKYKWVRDLTR